MPRGDKTGPNGLGSKTGRALGYCVGNNHVGFEGNLTTYDRGNGFGKRKRNGRIMRYGFRYGASNFTQETFADVKEETLIQNQINILKDQLESLEEKLKTLKK